MFNLYDFFSAGLLCYLPGKNPGSVVSQLYPFRQCLVREVEEEEEQQGSSASSAWQRGKKQ